VRILIVGDTHGKAQWLREYIYPVALTVGADAIVQLGDFGAWEHHPAGVSFMDEVNDLSQDTEIPMYWVRGNHDNIAHTLENYQSDSRGFVVCREFVFHIPDGHRWQWGGVSFRAFGGAYSVDKAWRVQREQEQYLHELREAQGLAKKTGAHVVVQSHVGTLWFPEEEMSDSRMSELLDADERPVDVILSHDKPYSAKPGWNRKDLPGCIPNQLRLERALRRLKPAYWLHGHLHHYYRDGVFGEDFSTFIVGLDPDRDAAEPGWKANQSWALAEVDGGKLNLKIGFEKHLDTELMASNVAYLG
jgi:Icc-related predicted phosphoesterase